MTGLIVPATSGPVIPPRAGSKPAMTRNRYGHGWMIKLSTIDLAIHIVEIAQPVSVCVTRKMDPATLGLLDREDHGTWRIYLDRFLTVRQASITLWHELVHVEQAERAGGIEKLEERIDQERVTARLDGPQQRRFFRLRAYRNLPLEREAEEHAQALHKRLHLAVATHGPRRWCQW